MYSILCEKLFETYYIPIIRIHITGTQNVKFQQNNPKTYVIQTVTDCLNRVGITIIDHPSYSPDLALSEFWLFDLIKKIVDEYIDVESQKKHQTKVLQKINKKRV